MTQYGQVRVDFITYTTGVAPNEANVTANVSGLFNSPTFSGNVLIRSDLNVSGFTGLFASGSQTSPSISFIDDGDTGLYNFGPNHIGITTNGSGSVFIDLKYKHNYKDFYHVCSLECSSD